MPKQVYPSMHTAQHLLNQTMIRLYNCGRNINAHIEKKKSKCDYRFDRILSQDEIENVENKINEIITSDLKISEEYISLKEASKDYDLSRLIEKTDKIRIVKIGDYDAVPCVGEHVSSTREIGQFKIISSTYKNNILRIRFKLIS